MCIKNWFYFSVYKRNASCSNLGIFVSLIDVILLTENLFNNTTIIINNNTYKFHYKKILLCAFVIKLNLKLRNHLMIFKYMFSCYVCIFYGIKTTTKITKKVQYYCFFALLF